ncbi:MAG: phosphoglucosamine mutase [Coriobacteriia bacterium]|nr:phosphoglucosamine mutase [Coriobacteriia bacterium]
MLLNEISFGTDGWRAVVGSGFNDDNVRLVARATALTFLDSLPLQESLQKPRIYIGYDTREHADHFAQLVAETMAAQGLEVILSDSYIPTPALCWTVSRDAQAIGGIQLTASHNPAGWLGLKVRMNDGGAAPADFTKKIEALIASTAGAKEEPTESKDKENAKVITKDLVSAYLDAICQFVDDDAIRDAGLKVVVDPLFGASRVYLAETFEHLGVEVLRLHDEQDFSFGNLHPEPIPPWTDGLAAAVRKSDAVAGFALDGDADRLGAVDEEGNFVSPHKILALIAQHLIENRGQSGRIVKTLSTSQLVDRLARSLGTELTTTPIGFKWIYEEMLAGDVMVGGEESGGIGIPCHVRERDGLLMSLLLAEMMAVTGLSLKVLVEQLEAQLGKLYYQRQDVTLEPLHMDCFRAVLPTLAPARIAETPVVEHVHSDGAKFILPDDEWLLLRTSGTEPLVRIYAEAANPCRLALLLEAGNHLVQEAK